VSLNPLPGLDQLAAEPALATTLPPTAATALLGRCHIVQSALIGRLLSAQTSAEGEPGPAAAGDDQLLTVPQVANLLGVPKGYSYDLARRGEIPTVRFGKYVRVPTSALRQWIAQHEGTRLDRAMYSAYSRRQGRHDRRGASANSTAPRTDAGAPGRTARRDLDDRRPMGTGRGADSGADGEARPAPGHDGAAGQT